MQLFSIKKIHFKILSRNGGHFVQASMCKAALHPGTFNGNEANTVRPGGLTWYMEQVLSTHFTDCFDTQPENYHHMWKG